MSDSVPLAINLKQTSSAGIQSISVSSPFTHLQGRIVYSPRAEAKTPNVHALSTMIVQDILFPRDASDDRQSILLKVTIAFHMVGLIGCTLTLATVLFSNVHRHPTWLSFMFTWSVSVIAYLLLFMTGQLDNPDPPFRICFAQASMIYSVPLLTAASTLALVSQVYFSVRSMFSDQLRRQHQFFHVVLLYLPYVLFGSMTITCVILGLNDRNIVQRASLNSPYCHLKNRIPSRIASIGVATMILPALFLEAMVCRHLWNNRRVLNARKSSTSIAIRVLSFLFLGLISTGVSLVFASTNDRDPEMNLILSLMPAGAFLLFGTQMDIFRAWMFWKPTESTKSTPGASEEWINVRAPLRNSTVVASV